MPQYSCPMPWLPQASLITHAFATTGSVWATYPALDSPGLRCAYTAAGAPESVVAADLNHYPARADSSFSQLGWTWFQAVEPLDAAHRWTLECTWLPPGCAEQDCAAQALTQNFGERSIFEPRGPGVDVRFVDPVLVILDCLGPEVRLRLQTQQGFDWGFWEDGGALRVGYADGTWAVTGPDPDARVEGAMITVAAPTRGDAWFGVEVVRGDGVVLEAVRFEPKAKLWDEIERINYGYGYGGGREGPSPSEGGGCKRR